MCLVYRTMCTMCYNNNYVSKNLRVDLLKIFKCDILLSNVLLHKIYVSLKKKKKKMCTRSCIIETILYYIVPSLKSIYT